MRKGILIASTLLVLFSCVHREEVKVPQEKIPKIVNTGNAAVTKLMGEFKKNLGKAIQERGLAGAVSFCAHRAEKIAQAVNGKLSGIKVTRVSEKYRNPMHKPDKIDSKALRYFEEKLQKGQLPPYYITAIREKGKIYYIYYKPITVVPFCLNCHGNPKKMDPEILKVIKEKYPNDRALNYKPGDLRGAFKVIIPEDRM